MENLLTKLRTSSSSRKGSSGIPGIGGSGGSGGSGGNKVTRAVVGGGDNNANKPLSSSISPKTNKAAEAEDDNNCMPLGVQGFSSSTLAATNLGNSNRTDNNNGASVPFASLHLTGNGEKLIKPISGLEFLSDDARAFAEMIQRVRKRGLVFSLCHSLCLSLC